ncbi:MAG: branched-chain amino acid ABC transporter permease [Sulfuritalea sp.]|jgi:branched-chain amino acid transport system permease protein|nr:branched-chain amino acid ABC transporter permease [Sulfuritalea sp.]
MTEEKIAVTSESTALPRKSFATFPVTRPTLALLLSVAALILIVPPLLDALYLRVFISSVIFTIAATGIAVLYARLGLVSLAQVALVGVGGWVTLRMWHATGLPFEVNMLTGAMISGVVGMLIGLPALRMRGLFLALITLMGAAGFQILVTGTQFPNGGEGVLGIAVTSIFMPRPVLGESDEAMLRYVCVVAVLCVLFVELNRRTRPGRAWALIRKSEACAMASGVNVAFYKAWGFALAGFIAGIAGALLAATLGVLDATTFPASESILLFALTVVGGAYNWLGLVLTGLLFRAAPALLNDIGVNGHLAYVIFGAGLLHALITAPTGIAGQILEGLKQLTKRRVGR